MTNQLDKKSQAWSALFSEPMSELVKRYTASVFFDKRLWQADITGSLAHADMLAAQGIISAQDHADIQRGMAEIRAQIEAGSFDWQLDLEDVHLNIEARLTALVGPAGKRLHTGRSRNDQVATDVRLWLRGEIDRIAALLNAMQSDGKDLPFLERDPQAMKEMVAEIVVASIITHDKERYREIFRERHLELKKHLEGKIGKHEMPVALEVRAELPKTPVGKLSKKELKEEERAKAQAKAA